MSIGFLKKMARGKKTRKNSTLEESSVSDEVNNEIKRKIIGERIKSYRDIGKSSGKTSKDYSLKEMIRELELLEQRIESMDEIKGMSGSRRFEIKKWSQPDYENSSEAIESMRMFLSFLPPQIIQKNASSFTADKRIIDSFPVHDSMISENGASEYDMKKIIASIADEGIIFEAPFNFDTDMIICFARIEGIPVGIIADKTLFILGTPENASSDKASKFIRFCDTFNIPIITIAESTCFMPEFSSQWDKSIRHGAKLLWSYSAANVPKILLITKKAEGQDQVSCSPELLGADAVFAWSSSPEPEEKIKLATKQERKNKRTTKTPSAKSKTEKEGYGAFFSGGKPVSGFEEKLIRPSETRIRIASALSSLFDNKRDSESGKNKKYLSNHGLQLDWISQ